ncbi:MAG: hypothetical protein QOG20_1190 [Pseudonocardiales bacterium]|nr:hypothetical protein [Pseudonocardiales bacterium]
MTGAVVLPDGTVVHGRGRGQALPDGPPPDFGLYLGLARIRTQRHTGWPTEWIDRPDFRTPRDDDAAAQAIVRTHAVARSGRRVERG